MKVVNLYGGPGSGKSTTASAVFANLKNSGYDVELVREFAKDLVYEQSDHVLENQLYVTAMQYKRLKDLSDYGVDIVITDSPIYLGVIYGKNTTYYNELKALISSIEDEFENIDVFVKRTKQYNPSGRLQTEEESDEISKLLLLTKPFRYAIEGNADGQKALTLTLIDLHLS